MGSITKQAYFEQILAGKNPPAASFSIPPQSPIWNIIRNVFYGLTPTNFAPSAPPPDNPNFAPNQPSAPPMPQSSTPMPAPSAPSLAALQDGLPQQAPAPAIFPPSSPAAKQLTQPAQGNRNLSGPSIPVINSSSPPVNQGLVPNSAIGKSPPPTGTPAQQNTATFSNPLPPASYPNLNAPSSSAASSELPPASSGNVPERDQSEANPKSNLLSSSSSAASTSSTGLKSAIPNEPASFVFSRDKMPSSLLQAKSRSSESSRNEPGAFTAALPGSPKGEGTVLSAAASRAADPRVSAQVKEGPSPQTTATSMKAPALPVLSNASVPISREVLLPESHPNVQINTGIPQTALSSAAQPAGALANPQTMSQNASSPVPQAKASPSANPSLPGSSTSTGSPPQSESAKGAPTPQPAPAASSPAAPANLPSRAAAPPEVLPSFLAPPANPPSRAAAPPEVLPSFLAPPANPPSRAAVPPEVLPGFLAAPGSGQKQEGPSNPKSNATVPFSSPNAISKSASLHSPGSVREVNGVAEDDEEGEEGEEEDDEEDEEETS